MFDAFNISEFPAETLPALMIRYAKYDMINDIYIMRSDDIDKYKSYLENSVEFYNKNIISSKIIEKKKNILDFFSKTIILGESMLSKFEYIAIFYLSNESYNIAEFLTNDIILHEIELMNDDNSGWHIRVKIHEDCLKINND